MQVRGCVSLFGSRRAANPAKMQNMREDLDEVTGEAPEAAPDDISGGQDNQPLKPDRKQGIGGIGAKKAARGFRR